MATLKRSLGPTSTCTTLLLVGSYNGTVYRYLGNLQTIHYVLRVVAAENCIKPQITMSKLSKGCTKLLCETQLSDNIARARATQTLKTDALAGNYQRIANEDHERDLAIRSIAAFWFVYL